MRDKETNEEKDTYTSHTRKDPEHVHALREDEQRREVSFNIGKGHVLVENIGFVVESDRSGLRRDDQRSVIDT